MLMPIHGLFRWRTNSGGEHRRGYCDVLHAPMLAAATNWQSSSRAPAFFRWWCRPCICLRAWYASTRRWRCHWKRTPHKAAGLSWARLEAQKVAAAGWLREPSPVRHAADRRRVAAKCANRACALGLPATGSGGVPPSVFTSIRPCTLGAPRRVEDRLAASANVGGGGSSGAEPTSPWERRTTRAAAHTVSTAARPSRCGGSRRIDPNEPRVPPVALRLWHSHTASPFAARLEPACRRRLRGAALIGRAGALTRLLCVCGPC